MNNGDTELEDKIEKKETTKKSSPKKKTSFGNTVVGIWKGDLKTKISMNYLPFIFYITLLLLMYIFNNYYAVKTEIKISSINKELKELRYEYITTTSDLMHITRRSVVAKRSELTSKGIKDLKDTKDSLATLYKIYKEN